MTPRPISLAFFSNTQVRGGAEEHILTLLRGLDRKYFRLHLICSFAVAEKIQHDVPSDVVLLPLTLHSPIHGANAIRLGRFLREHHIDILHSHLFYSSLFGSPVGRLCGVPVIIETPHLREYWRKGWKAHFFVDRLIGRCVDYYIAVSDANARYLVNEKRLPARKVRVIRNGCDLERFARTESLRPYLRAELGFQADDLVLVVAARLTSQKGHRVLLEALPLVRRDFPRVKLVCVGDGDLRRQLEQQTRELNLDDIVRFVGYQTDIPKWLSMADVSVLPSFFEGLPLIAIESLAAGRPMVATAVDGTPEVILNGRTGFTVASNDVGGLAEAIGRLLRDPELRDSFGRAGRALVAEHFTQKRQIEQTEQLYFQAFQQVTRRTSPINEATELHTVNAAE